MWRAKQRANINMEKRFNRPSSKRKQDKLQTIVHLLEFFFFLNQSVKIIGV